MSLAANMKATKLDWKWVAVDCLVEKKINEILTSGDGTVTKLQFSPELLIVFRVQLQIII